MFSNCKKATQWHNTLHKKPVNVWIIYTERCMVSGHRPSSLNEGSVVIGREHTREYVWWKYNWLLSIFDWIKKLQWFVAILIVVLVRLSVHQQLLKNISESDRLNSMKPLRKLLLVTLYKTNEKQRVVIEQQQQNDNKMATFVLKKNSSLKL